MNAGDSDQRPVRLLVTMGDPCGVGPEICIKALAGNSLPDGIAFTVVGSLSVLDNACEASGESVPFESVDGPAQGVGSVAVIDMDNFPPAMLSERKATAEGGRASVDYIERAVAETLQGRADAIVTCPINKEAIGAAGCSHPGHTEMLAELTGGGRPVMLLVSGNLRVAFATTHLALCDVSQIVTTVDISHTGIVLGAALKDYFGVAEPRLGVCALNPHAGDGGRFGDEEARIIAPAIEDIRQAGIDASGPYPSDTLFAKAAAGQFDAVIAMYHDQGMIPIKLAGLGDVVNVTLGLPIVRTSPGHGTAYDIAGTGLADESSLMAAVRLAVSMARAGERQRSKNR